MSSSLSKLVPGFKENKHANLWVHGFVALGLGPAPGACCCCPNRTFDVHWHMCVNKEESYQNKRETMPQHIIIVIIMTNKLGKKRKLEETGSTIDSIGFPALFLHKLRGADSPSARLDACACACLCVLRNFTQLPADLRKKIKWLRIPPQPPRLSWTFSAVTLGYSVHVSVH